MPDYPYLDQIDTPADLRKLKVTDLKGVSNDVREYLIDTISQTGGHFGAGLGVVELSVALHYALNTPTDKVIWDVGHQAYPHKILTGRKDRLSTIRKTGGLAPFLKREESDYDVFGAGHASTSISAALGIATARDFAGDTYKVAAVIGDGSMTGGIAYEALNNCGMLRKDILVILNDNRMSIAPNVWALHEYFNSLITNPKVRKFKDQVWDKLEGHDRLRLAGSKLVDGMKAVMTPGMMFEALGFKYFGPINGHNVVKLVETLEFLKDQTGPLLLHVITEKGKGYAPAESHVQRYHAASGAFDKITGAAIVKPIAAPTPPEYTKVFGNALLEICKANPLVVGITAAMPDGTGLNILQKELPDRFFDVGIAEQHAVTFAAGMATQGFTPVCAIYSTFLQRAFDQIVHDVALQKLPVVFALDRAGLVGADGPTHHGAFDLSYLRLIPNMTIMVPKDEQELRDMLFTATSGSGELAVDSGEIAETHSTPLYPLSTINCKGPIAIRYPRGAGVGVPLAAKGFRRIPIGQGEMLRDGSDVVVVGVGPILYEALKAAEDLAVDGISVAVANARFVKPLDAALLEGLAARFKHIVTVEENTIAGGFGSAVAEYFASRNILHPSSVIPHPLIIGIPDQFIEHGAPQALSASIGLTREGIRERVRALVQTPILTGV
ncbi:MAG: 1-deoxy-D-xylulose-5-phosphate synthase [Bacteroidota bacterium]|nr:1-deoxy-D-xylulose-5-phosphate synthase [Bacteroidota bacterium]MDP4232243.1 1-deoxy-D-xylulose-5-phosphate synthase [Bacteroidota bacterium]MDP4243578.1 1-deoxy-D-xylulose-5-phosphate synthase [Bacteroidota bacterium]MDP4289113.1 1-deoxy-D-xylulose-5-phosphate synthase [Bacteroidota bacterium]